MEVFLGLCLVGFRLEGRVCMGLSGFRVEGSGFRLCIVWEDGFRITTRMSFRANMPPQGLLGFLKS